MQQHREVFGNPDSTNYDGIHFSGPSGRAVLTNSVCKILTDAGLIKKEEVKNIPDGWKLGSDPHPSKPDSSNFVYDPLTIFKKDLEARKLAAINVKAARPPPTSFRASVISKNPGASPYQTQYNVPVSNPFSCLGNF